jgi:hypothetical protein
LVEVVMKVMVRVSKDGNSLYTEAHDVADAESFGRAFREVWVALRRRQFEAESNVGALMEHLDHGVLEQVTGASISLTRV